MKYLRNYLMISLAIFIASCDNHKKFYEQIRNYNNYTWGVCELQYDEQPSIVIVDELSTIMLALKKEDPSIGIDSYVEHLKQNKPIKVSKKLYDELYKQRVISQPRIDSLFEIDYKKIIHRDRGWESLDMSSLPNSSYMEYLYTIKKLFDLHVLLARDCETGYSFITNGQCLK